jgi:hypothetical protein
VHVLVFQLTALAPLKGLKTGAVIAAADSLEMPSPSAPAKTFATSLAPQLRMLFYDRLTWIPFL